jgi:chromosome segregation ATPase
VLSSAVLLALSACKTSGSGTEQASSTVKDLETLRTELAKGQSAIGNAVSTLTTLEAEGGDMAAEYKAYKKAVDDVSAQRGRVQKARESLVKRRVAFTASWDEQVATIQNPDLRERAAERRADVVDRFQKIEAQGKETQADLDAWHASLVDVQTYLENDLNPSGVSSLEDVIKSIGKDATKLDESVGEYVSKLDELIKAIGAAELAPPAAATPAS